MKKDSQNLLATLSFIVLTIFALLLAVEYILPIIGVNLEGTLLNILNTIKNFFIVVIIGVMAFSFIEGKAKWLVWVFWISIIIIIVATVIMWL